MALYLVVLPHRMSTPCFFAVEPNSSETRRERSLSHTQFSPFPILHPPTLSALNLPEVTVDVCFSQKADLAWSFAGHGHPTELQPNLRFCQLLPLPQSQATWRRTRKAGPSSRPFLWVEINYILLTLTLFRSDMYWETLQVVSLWLSCTPRDVYRCTNQWPACRTCEVDGCAG